MRNNTIKYETPQERDIRVLHKTELFNENVPVEGRHLFVEKRAVFDAVDVYSKLSSCTMVSKLYPEDVSYVGIEEFLTMLEDFEEEQSKRTGHSSFRMLEEIKVLIPHDYDLKNVEDIVNYVSSAFESEQFPHFYGVYTEGNGRYLSVWYSERMFYPEGKEIDVLAKSDFYRDPCTGRRCRKDDPGAVLSYAKGSVIKKDFIMFSEKKRLFRISDGLFYALISKIKMFLKDHFDALKCEGRGFLLGRVDSRDYPKHGKALISLYNQFFMKVERELNSVAHNAHMAGLYMKDVFSSLVMAIREIQTAVVSSIRIDNRSYRFRTYFYAPFGIAAASLDFKKRKILSMFRESITALFGEQPGFDPSAVIPHF